VIDPLRVPAVVAVNRAVTAQLPPAAMLRPAVQVFDAMAKSAPVTVIDAITNAAVPVLVIVAT